MTAIIGAILISSCNYTRHLKDDEYLLKSNSIQYIDDKYLTTKGEITDNLDNAIVQQPNTSFLFDWLKPRLFIYNLRYEKHSKTKNKPEEESRSVEPPVLYDSTTIPQSRQYMEAYMFHQGYFYARVTDTTIFNRRKRTATVEYTVHPGINYLVNNVYFNNIEDSVARSIVRNVFKETSLRAGKPYSAGIVEQEKARITKTLRDSGYYYFTGSLISFELDTVHKKYEKVKESLINDAADIITLKKEQERPTLDIYIRIKNSEDGKAFHKYAINRITVYPDYVDREDRFDSTMVIKKVNNTTFRYHDYYIREKVLDNHIFLLSNTFYSEEAYDKTITELNQLGVFESVRVVFFEDTSRKDGVQWLNCAILLSRAKKFDFNAVWEASNGSTYTLGSGITLSASDKNLAKGANLLTASVNTGVETQLDTNNRFQMLTFSRGVNASLEFPKFLLPIGREHYSIRNSPRTEIALGANILDRVNFFRLVNLTSRFTYKWKETSTKSWEASPIFINDISLPSAFISESFQKRLDTSDFLQKAYRSVFIEGENLAWTFNNASKARFYDDYSYVRLSIEEAGGIIAGLNSISSGLTKAYSQYVKLDYDLRHFIKQRHATTVFRAYGGIGLPLDTTGTLPYIKQYFVGGPFSMRGWRVRTLGPGSYTDTLNVEQTTGKATSLLDRTGDIKIEFNAEYRFDIFKLFAGVLQFNGALFADAGNIWLSKPSQSYPNGEFKLDRLYKDLAVSSGAGIRIDIAGMFLLRGDIGIPVKVPGNLYIPSKSINQGWVINDIQFGNKDWRRKNMVFNIAIGYPF